MSFRSLPRFALALASLSAALAAPLTAQVIEPERIDAAVGKAVAREWMVGGVLGQLDGEQQLVHGFGQLSRDDATRPDGDTLYEIGSVTKVFTGLLLADAVVRGELELETPIAELLPDDVELQVVGRPITLLDLSTHTSGLPRMPGNLIPLDLLRPYEGYDDERLLAYIDGLRPDRAPGAEYEYSNLAVGLLGILLAERAGSDYPTLLRERVFEPLGMHDSSVVLDDDVTQRLAPPHDTDAEPSAAWDLFAMRSAGGIRSSVRDMLRYARFCVGDIEPAGSESLAAALQLSMIPRREVTGDPRMRMGLGWHINIDEGIWWHNGQTGGYHAMFEVLPEEGRAAVGLSNTANGVIEQLTDRVIVEWLGGDELALRLPDQVRIAAAAMEPLVGAYHSPAAGVMLITREEQRLYARLSIQPRFRLWFESPRRVFYRVVEAQVEFLEGNPAPGLTLFQNGMELPFERVPDEEDG